MAIFAYILEKSRKGPFLSLKMRAKEDFNRNLFTFVIITNFKTYRYLNNFQEHSFGLLRLRKYQSHFKISFPCENEAIKHNLVDLKVQYLKVFCCHGNKSTILLFDSIFRTTPEVSGKLYFVEISLRKVMAFSSQKS